VSLRRFIGEVERAVDKPAAVRDALVGYLRDPGFQLDCLERLLRPGRRLEANPPIYMDGRLNYRLRVFFWMPGYFVPPHQHNTWGVTGVLHGEAAVQILRREGARLVPERGFLARAGEAGYLLPPCTHSVGNPGKSVCATFHVFSVSADESARRSDTLWYPALPGAPREEPRGALLRGAAEMLAAIGGARARRLLESDPCPSTSAAY
jgi:hypothetical protein